MNITELVAIKQTDAYWVNNRRQVDKCRTQMHYYESNCPW